MDGVNGRRDNAPLGFSPRTDGPEVQNVRWHGDLHVLRVGDVTLSLAGNYIPLCISCSTRVTRRDATRLDSVSANSLSPCSQGYLLRHWFALSLATSVPFVLLFSYYWIIPESPRWLLSKNRIDEAEVIVQRMARINGKTVPSNFLRKMEVTLRAEPITVPEQR